MTSRYGTPMMAFVVAAAMALVASSAESGQIKIDNGGVATLPGILSYDGEGGRAFGAEIQFIQITGIDTPFHAGETLICRGCFLNFATGDNIVEGPAFWTFAGGGIFSLDGDILPDGGDFLGFSGNILRGFFTNNPPNVAIGTENAIFAFNGFGQDIKAPALVESFYGIPQDTNPPPIFNFSNTELTGFGTVDDNGGFIVEVDDADIKNALPEPGSSLLVVLGLSGLAMFSRRKNRQE